LLLNVNVPDEIELPVFRLSPLSSAKALVRVKQLRPPSTIKLRSTFFRRQVLDCLPEERARLRRGPANLTGRCAR
jgi:hypothetical protein